MCEMSPNVKFFSCAFVSSVSGLTQAQLDTACVDEQTKLPAELNRPAPCAAKTKR